MTGSRYIPRIFFTMAVTATLVLSWMAYQMETREMRQRFLHQARMMATSIEPDLLDDLRGHPADKTTVAYARIEEHLQRLTPQFQEVQLTCLFMLHPDGTPVFLMNSEPGGSNLKARPGKVHEDITSSMRVSLESNLPFVTPSHGSGGGQWVSAVIPLHADPESGGKFFFVANISAERWDGALLKFLGWLTPVIALIFLVLGGRWILKYRVVKGSEQRDRVDLAAFFLTGGLLSSLIAGMFHHMEVHREESLFRNIAEMRTQQVREAIDDLENAFLHPVAREIALSENDPLFAFEHAVQFRPIPPSLDALGWVARVPSTELPSFLRSMRALDPNFEIWEVDEAKSRQPAAPREVYFPVVRVLPRDEIHPARGFDEWSEPNRRKALQQAMLSGELSFSAPVALVYMLDQRGNLTCFYPVRDPETDRFIGLMVGGVKTSQLLSLSKTLPHLQSLGDVTEGTLYFESGGELARLTAPVEGAPDPGFSTGLVPTATSVAAPLHLGGQTFLLHLYPGTVFEQYHRPWMGWIIGLGGAVVWLIATLGLGALFRHRTSLQKEVARQTREVQKSEARFRQLFEESTEAYIWAEGDRIIRGNQALCRMLDCSPDQLAYSHLWKFAPKYQPDGNPSKAQARSQIEHLLREGRHEFEWQYRRTDGSLFWASMHLTRLDREGGPLIFGSVRDISQRKASMEDNQRLRTAVEQADEVVMITDAAGTIEYVNPAFETTTGYSRDEALGLKPSLLKSDRHPESFYEEMWETLLTGNKWEGRLTNRTKSGSLIHEQATISPVREKSGKIVNFIAVKRNITRELELEEQFQQSQKMETVGQLAGGVAHDFNNILQAIMGYGSLATSQLKGHPAASHIEELIKASQRAAGVTRQLLTFSRRSAVRLSAVDLNATVEGMLKMIGRLLEDHIHIRLELEADLPKVEADAGQIEQILLNLCINSRDAMPGGGTIEIRTGKVEDPGTLRGRHDLAAESFVYFSVQDSGEGIAKSELPKIFNPFYTTKVAGQGTGLGLSSTYGIVRQHRGAIEVKSEVGEGTTMTVYLPAGEAERASADEKKTEAPPTGGDGQTILIADDYSQVLELTCKILEEAGYRVLTASNGHEANDWIARKGNEIDLVISDLIMPGGGGREIRKQVKTSFPDLPFLFMSGYDPDSDAARDENDPTEVLRKPFQPGELLQAIHRLLKESGRPAGAKSHETKTGPRPQDKK